MIAFIAINIIFVSAMVYLSFDSYNRIYKNQLVLNRKISELLTMMQQLIRDHEDLYGSGAGKDEE